MSTLQEQTPEVIEESYNFCKISYEEMIFKVKISKEGLFIKRPHECTNISVQSLLQILDDFLDMDNLQSYTSDTKIISDYEWSVECLLDVLNTNKGTKQATKLSSNSCLFRLEYNMKNRFGVLTRI
jgi:hypothetical protein